jgi:hypothetical protein
MKMHQKIIIAGMRIILEVMIEYGVVVLGSTIPGSVAQRIGSGAMLAAGTTSSVFAWLFPSRRDITLLCP